MNQTKEKITLQDKLENFAKFVRFVSGELNININFGESNDSKAIHLPDITNLDEKKIDFLYALLLREAGLLSKSKRTVEDYNALKTFNEIEAVNITEQARIERYLLRKFPGASSVLEKHWAIEAHDPDLSKIAFGFDPAKASPEQVFFSALKFKLLGSPKSFKWENIFGEKKWSEALSLLNKDSMNSILLEKNFKNFNDSKELALTLLKQYYKLTKTKDESKELVKSKSQKMLEKIEEEMAKTIPQKIAEESKLIEKNKEEIEKLREMIEQKREEFLKNQGITKEEYNELKSSRATLNKVSKLQEKIENIKNKKNEIAESLETKTATAKTSLDDKIKNYDEKQRTAEETVNNKREALEEKIENKKNEYDEKSSKLQEKIAQLEKIIEDLKQEQASKENKNGETEESSVKNKERALQKLSEKITENERLLNNAKQKLSDNNTKKEESLKELNEKLENYKNELERKLKEIEEKKQITEVKAEDSLLKKIERQEEMLKKTLEKESNNISEFEKLLKELGVSMNDVNGEKLSTSLEETNKKIENIEKHFSSLQNNANKIESLKTSNKNTEHEISKKLSQSMSKLQEMSNQAGLDLNFLPEFDKMEGFEGADKAQHEFDKMASKELEVNVVNGEGGGKGYRDMMLNIADKKNELKELNPNLIFEGIQKLSPLSGFSESGVVEGKNKNNVKQLAAQGSQLVKFRHTVWSKEFDVVKKSNNFDNRQEKYIRENYAKVIKEVKEVFLTKIKPSFKIKFKGAQEEGDIDPRNIYKLALQTDNDFYEKIIKKDDKKSSAVIMVDLSGSISSWGDDAEEKLQATVLAIGEGLKEVRVEYEVIGFYAEHNEKLSAVKIPNCFNRKSCNLNTLILKDFSDKNIKLADLKIQQAENSDGESLRIVVDRLKKRPSKKKLIFMISDGKPFMQDSNPDILDNDLRLSIDYAINNKTLMYSLGYNDYHPILGDNHIGLKSVFELPSKIKNSLSLKSNKI